MRIKSSKVIDFIKDNPWVSGCTISQQIALEDSCSIFVFSMAPNTSISAEYYEYSKIITLIDGDLDIQGTSIKVGQTFITEKNSLVGIQSTNGCIYLEIGLAKETKMNSVLKAGEVFKLADLLPYQEDKIVNMDLINEAEMKFVIMSFDEGTGLSEHAAPAEALVFALDGEAIIGYEGKEFSIKAGETFKFDKHGKHFVKAVKRFKMALLLTF